jgi:signal transduction histidine kinase
VTTLLAAVPQPRQSPERTERRGPDRPADLASGVLALAEAQADAAADGLHDGALQALVVARYAADVAVRGGDAALARDAVQEALVALRHAVWSLRPRGAQGLREALDQLSAHLVATGGSPLDVDVDEPAAAVMDSRLAPAVATVAYRFVQAAAGERPLTLRVRRTSTGLRLALDVAVADRGAHALRARAVGATLLATRDFTTLHLPLTDPTSPPEDTP